METPSGEIHKCSRPLNWRYIQPFSSLSYSSPKRYVTKKRVSYGVYLCGAREMWENKSTGDSDGPVGQRICSVLND